MFVILASCHDESARELARRWGSRNAAVLTGQDLSRSGWRYWPDRLADSTAIIGGEKIRAQEIQGVLTRLAYVPEHELRQIAREDRAYVAAEMTAFLRSWLASLRCPVLNPPTSTCLSGPGWHQEQAVHTAAGLGIPVRPVEWRVELSVDIPRDEPAPPGVTVTVVGDGCVGSPDCTLATLARRLAGSARVDLLAVRFEETEAGIRLCGADPWPDVSSPEVADAIIGYFCSGREC